MQNPGRLVMALLSAATLVGCGGGDDAEPDPVEVRLTRLSMRQRVALTVAARVQPEDSLLERMGAEIATGAAGALFVPAAAGADVAEAVDSLRQRAPWPLLVVADLAHRGGTLLGIPPAHLLWAVANDSLAGEAAAVTVRALTAIGADVGIVALPPLNAGDPISALQLERQAIMEGMRAYFGQSGGTAAQLSVRILDAAETSDAPLRWDHTRLAAVELPFLEATVAEEPPALLLASSRLPAISGDGLPLTLSPTAIEGLLRRDLAYRGAVMVDLGATIASTAGYEESAAAIDALRAGADLLLGVSEPARVVDAVVDAIAAGDLDEERVTDAARAAIRLRLPHELADSVRAARRADWPGARKAVAELLRQGPVRLAAAIARAPTARAVDSLFVAARQAASGRDSSSAASSDSAAGTAKDGEIAPATGLEPEGGAKHSGASAQSASADGAASDSAGERSPRASAAERLTAVGSGGESVGAEAKGAISDLRVRPELLRVDWPSALRWPPSPSLRVVAPDSAAMSAELPGEIEEILREALADSVFSAAAIAVGRRGSLVVLKGYGREGRQGQGAPVDPRRTIFDLASLTKVVGTSTAVALLVDDGRMSLDAPLQRYLASFRGEGKEEVLIRHLLTHTSGLPSGLWLFGSADSPGEALREVVEQPLLWKPGERVEYSDLGMILLAAAAERAAGMPLDRFLAERLFAPLGMMSTMYLPPLAVRDAVVPTAEVTERDFPLVGIVHDANSFRLGGVAGHAGLFSTARDLAIFAQMMLAGGSYGTLRILSPGIVERFTTRQPDAEQRALGWDTPSRVSSAGDYFSAQSFGHTGYTGTSLWIDPVSGVFVVLLTNRTYMEATARETLRLRAAVHDAAARAVTDLPLSRRN